MMQFKDRTLELRRIRAGDLKPSPKNWRRHPPAQRAALEGVLREVGFAGALLARETESGVLELIDGHLRAETAPDAIVPVLVLDVTAAEADKLLATHDPITLLAETNAERLNELRSSLDLQEPALRKLLEDVSRAAQRPVSDAGAECDIPESYELVVTCADEADQRQLFERLKSDGYECRVLTM